MRTICHQKNALSAFSAIVLLSQAYWYCQFSFEKTKTSKNDTTAELFLLYLLGIEASCAALVVLYIKDIFYPS